MDGMGGGMNGALPERVIFRACNFRMAIPSYPYQYPRR